MVKWSAKTILFITGPSPLLSSNKIQPKKKGAKVNFSRFHLPFFFYLFSLLLLLLLLLLEAAMSLVGCKRIHKGTTPFPIPVSALTFYLNIFLEVF